MFVFLMSVVAPICTGVKSVLLYVRGRMVRCSTNKPHPCLSPSLSRSSAGKTRITFLFVFVDVSREFHYNFFSEFQSGIVWSFLATLWVCNLLKQTLHVFSACTCNVSKLFSWGRLDLSPGSGLLCGLSLSIELLIRISIIALNWG